MRCTPRPLARDGVRSRRGTLRDALTLFDEFGACWPECPPSWLPPGGRVTGAVVSSTCALVAGQPARLVGHALLEQLALAPRKGLQVRACLLGDPLGDSAPRAGRRGPSCLPVLGVPGWWPANEAPGFYDDVGCFGQARQVGPAKPASIGRHFPAEGSRLRSLLRSPRWLWCCGLWLAALSAPSPEGLRAPGPRGARRQPRRVGGASGGARLCQRPPPLRTRQGQLLQIRTLLKTQDSRQRRLRLHRQRGPCDHELPRDQSVCAGT